MATKPAAPPSPPRSIPIAPSEQEWRAMSPDEHKRLLVEILAVVAEHRASTYEGWSEEDELLQERQRSAEARIAQAEARPEKADLAISGLQTGILAALESRRIVIEEGLRARVRSCDDPTLLQRWLLGRSRHQGVHVVSISEAVSLPARLAPWIPDVSGARIP